MRVVVVGSGVIGLLTAMECVLAGAAVSLADSAGIPSRAAMSHDRLRSVRALHHGDAGLTAIAARARWAWMHVEQRLGTRLVEEVGALTVLPAQEARAGVALLASAGMPAQVLAAGELSERYPPIRFPAGLDGVLEPVAGVVRADRALAAIAGWLRRQPGVELHPRSRVVAAGPGGARLAGGTVLAGARVVLAAGPWSRDLLPAALRHRLTLHRQTTLSYRPARRRHRWDGMPVIPRLGTADGAWLIPPVGDAPACLSAASASRPVAALTDRVPPARWRDHLVDRFGTLLADFDPAAVTGATDGYYLSATWGAGPLLARVDTGVWAYAACGGMSFKFAPLVGSALAARAIGRPSPAGDRADHRGRV